MKYIYAFVSFVFGIFTMLSLGMVLQVFIGIETYKVPIAIEGTIEYFDATSEMTGWYLGLILFPILFFVLFSFSFSLYHRLKKKKRDTINTSNIQGPFVLYLRSFIDDKKARKGVSTSTNIKTEEEALVEVLSEIAPVYAIGNPKDKKMPLGASRIYVDDEHWKSTVLDLAKRAVTVVLRLGKTDSFWWEVEMALQEVPIDKLLFVIPESKTFDNVATLYKILLDHNIDIKAANISIGKKRRGSISSFLFFNKKGLPQTDEIIIPRFTHIVLSYENILRNALSAYRSNFGLEFSKKRTIRLARIMEILILTYLPVVGGMHLFSDWVSLKYQMPYEFVERCAECPDFVNKYSNEINATNLTWGIVEARKGTFGLDDKKYKLLFLIEARAIQSMSYDEFDQLQAAPKNMLLMIKKYIPDSYDCYVETLSEATIISIRHPQEIEELMLQYKQNIDSMPQWVIDFANSEDMPEEEYEYILKYNSVIVEHIDDDGIADILKTLASQTITIGDNKTMR